MGAGVGTLIIIGGNEQHLNTVINEVLDIRGEGVKDIVNEFEELIYPLQLHETIDDGDELYPALSQYTDYEVEFEQNETPTHDIAACCVKDIVVDRLKLVMYPTGFT